MDRDSFLSRASDRHFFERPYLHHDCWLFITKTTRERMRTQSLFSTLARGSLTPAEVMDPRTTEQFLDAVAQAVSILEESGLLRLKRLTGEEITGSGGILSRYFSLGGPEGVTEDIRIDPGRMSIGDRLLCVHTLTDLDDLPQVVGTDSPYERLSTDRSECRLSFAAPVGLLLPHNHIYNQFVFIDDAEETLSRMESRVRNMISLSRYSRANAVNAQWTELYLNEAHGNGYLPVRCHCNIISWAGSEDELKRIANDVGAQISQMGCTPHHNTVDVPALFWGAIPGNEADSPAEESFYTFLEQALCFFTGETNYRDSPSPFGLRMTDRLSGVPVHVDISDLPMKMGVICNRNKFVLGPSGSGKSFFMNHFCRQYYEQGSHIVIIDIGGSYRGLCEMIRRTTNGRDGLYYQYRPDDPISFNPFYVEERGVYSLEKRESIKNLILSLWKGETERATRAEEVGLSNAVNYYLEALARNPEEEPSFNSFYRFVDRDYRRLLRQRNVREKDFDLDGFLVVLEPFQGKGEYSYLLNSDKGIDLLHRRFVVFELDELKDHKVLFPVTTLIIMEAFISKMRRLPTQRKVLVVDEAWKSLTRAGMAEYLKYMYKTERKHFGEVVTISQEPEDLIGSPIVKESIVSNSDCKILLDQRQYLTKFDAIQNVLGLSDKDKAQILSINQANDPARHYKEVWIGLGGVHSAVYGTEVSPEEYGAYTTEATEKAELTALVERRGGNIEAALRELADRRRTGK